MTRCPWTIRPGTSLVTQCDKDEHVPPDIPPEAMHEDEYAHEGPGLFPDQRIIWYVGDRREYTGPWPGYCPKLGSPLAFSGGCTLPSGHHGRCAP